LNLKALPNESIGTDEANYIHYLMELESFVAITQGYSFYDHICNDHRSCCGHYIGNLSIFYIFILQSLCYNLLFMHALDHFEGGTF
jgi:hypothetical protein